MATAAFDADSWVWLPDDDDLVVPAKVVKSFHRGEAADLVVNGQTIKVSAKISLLLEAADEQCFDAKIEDLISLNDLNESALLHTLRLRYAEDAIYTFVSDILISVNPFRLLPIYTAAVLEKYVQKGNPVLPPHCYSISRAAHEHLVQKGSSQAICISGESGAGKTEAMKLMLQHLAEASARSSQGAVRGDNVEQLILRSNPITEAFGNARTLRNDNSSRFGKWTALSMTRFGTIVGARIVQYLLEKSRVSFQAPGERNYHAMYQLITAGLDDEFFKNATAEDFAYTRSGSAVEGDATDLELLKSSLAALGVPEETEAGIWKTVGAVLLMGNVEFKPVDDHCEVLDDAPLSGVARLAGLEVEEMKEALVARYIGTRSVVRATQNAEQATAARDAFAKAAFAKLFELIVGLVNEALNTEKNAADLIIGVLDIFGFEFFAENSLEQLCINYCNEKLQHFFNDHVFSKERIEYEREQVPLELVVFENNEPTLELLEAKRFGFYAMLDEEVALPKGSDQSLAYKLQKQHEKNARFAKASPKEHNAELKFGVRHYAHLVVYSCEGFLEKNRDKLLQALEDLGRSANNPVMRQAFESEAATRRRGPQKKIRTVGGKFRGQLEVLMGELSRCEPHFVRCVKPNELKLPATFDSTMVQSQMRCAGVLEVCRIRRAGFPFRVEFGRFERRYACVAGDAGEATKGSVREVVRRIFKTDTTLRAFAEGSGYTVGKTKIFLRIETRDALELAREHALQKYFLAAQAAGRGYVVRCDYARHCAIRERLRAALRDADLSAVEDAMALYASLPYGGQWLPERKEALKMQSELKAASKVLKVLRAAIAANTIVALEGALKDCGSSEAVSRLRGRAVEALEHLHAAQRNRKTLREATEKGAKVKAGLVHGALSRLKAAMEAAGQCEELPKAREVFEALTRRVALRDALEAAVNLRDLPALQAALVLQVEEDDPLVVEATELLESLKELATMLLKLRSAVASCAALREIPEELPLLISKVRGSSASAECAEAETLIARVQKERLALKKLNDSSDSELEDRLEDLETLLRENEFTLPLNYSLSIKRARESLERLKRTEKLAKAMAEATSRVATLEEGEGEEEARLNLSLRLADIEALLSCGSTEQLRNLQRDALEAVATLDARKRRREKLRAEEETRRLAEVAAEAARQEAARLEEVRWEARRTLIAACQHDFFKSAVECRLHLEAALKEAQEANVRDLSPATLALSALDALEACRRELKEALTLAESGKCDDDEDDLPSSLFTRLESLKKNYHFDVEKDEELKNRVLGVARKREKRSTILKSLTAAMLSRDLNALQKAKEAASEAGLEVSSFRFGVLFAELETELSSEADCRSRLRKAAEALGAASRSGKTPLSELRSRTEDLSVALTAATSLGILLASSSSEDSDDLDPDLAFALAARKQGALIRTARTQLKRATQLAERSRGDPEPLELLLATLEVDLEVNAQGSTEMQNATDLAAALRHERSCLERLRAALTADLTELGAAVFEASECLPEGTLELELAKAELTKSQSHARRVESLKQAILTEDAAELRKLLEDADDEEARLKLSELDARQREIDARDRAEAARLAKDRVAAEAQAALQEALTTSDTNNISLRLGEALKAGLYDAQVVYEARSRLREAEAKKLALVALQQALEKAENFLTALDGNPDPKKRVWSTLQAHKAALEAALEEHGGGESEGRRARLVAQGLDGRFKAASELEAAILLTTSSDVVSDGELRSAMGRVSRAYPRPFLASRLEAAEKAASRLEKQSELFEELASATSQRDVAALMKAVERWKNPGADLPDDDATVVRARALIAELNAETALVEATMQGQFVLDREDPNKTSRRRASVVSNQNISVQDLCSELGGLLKEARKCNVASEIVSKAEFVEANLKDLGMMMGMLLSSNPSNSLVYNASSEFSSFSRLRTPADFGEGFFSASQRQGALETRFRHSTQPLHRSICAMPSESAGLNDLAKACHRNILGFSGDMYMLYPAPLAENLLAHGHAGGPLQTSTAALSSKNQACLIRDEIYLQLCKHLNENPTTNSRYRTWRLMLLCARTFPPSKELAPMVLLFCAKRRGDSSTRKVVDEVLKRLQEAVDCILENDDEYELLVALSRPPTASEIHDEVLSAAPTHDSYKQLRRASITRKHERLRQVGRKLMTRNGELQPLVEMGLLPPELKEVVAEELVDDDKVETAYEQLEILERSTEVASRLATLIERAIRAIQSPEGAKDFDAMDLEAHVNTVQCTKVPGIDVGTIIEAEELIAKMYDQIDLKLTLESAISHEDVDDLLENLERADDSDDRHLTLTKQAKRTLDRLAPPLSRRISTFFGFSGAQSPQTPGTPRHIKK